MARAVVRLLWNGSGYYLVVMTPLAGPCRSQDQILAQCGMRNTLVEWLKTTIYGAWRSSVARLLWEPISGVGGRRPPSEMLDFCVSCVGQRRWASEQSLAQFGILVDVPCYDGANGRRVAVIASLTAACEASIQAKADATLVPGDEQLTRGQPPGTSLSRYAAFASTASRLNDIGKYSWSAQLCARLP